MIEVGRICVKLAGRDAGKKCVIIDVLDKNFVMIDGGVRRRKCNIDHLEPTKDTIKISKNAAHDAVKKEFESLKLFVWETKPRQAKDKPKKQRKVKQQPEKVAKKKAGKNTKEAKPAAKKEDKPKKASTKKAAEKKK